MNIRTLLGVGGMARKLGLMARGNASEVLNAIPNADIVAARSDSEAEALKARAAASYDNLDVDISRQYSFGSIVKWEPGDVLQPNANILDDDEPMVIGRFGTDDAEKLERHMLVTRVAFRIIYQEKDTSEPVPSTMDRFRSILVANLKAGIFFVSIGTDRKSEYCKGSIGDYLDGHHLWSSHIGGQYGTTPAVDIIVPDMWSRDDGVANERAWQSPFILPAQKVINWNLRGPDDADQPLALSSNAPTNNYVLLVSTFQGIIIG